MTRAAARSFATFSAIAAPLAFSGVFGGCIGYPGSGTFCNDECVGNAARICDDFADGNMEGQLDECGPSRQCVVADRFNGYYAACALGGPDPKCNPQGNISFCEGRQVVMCRGAYRTRVIDCAQMGLFCASDTNTAVSYPDAQCIAASTPDPRCDDGPDTRYSFCDGEELVQCLGHFVRERDGMCDVARGRHCVSFPRTEDPPYPAHADCDPPL